MRGFTATEAAEIVGVTRRAIIDWGNRELVRADVQQSTGRGSSRIYSVRNLIQFACLREVFRLGITREEAKRFIEITTGKEWSDFYNFIYDTKFRPKQPSFWLIFVDGVWTSTSLTTNGVFEVSSEEGRKSVAHARSFIALNVGLLKKEVLEKL